MTKFNTVYGDKKRVSIKKFSKSRTKQSFKDECDINNVLTHWDRHGILTHPAKGTPKYMDVSDSKDYQTALNTVINAQALFDELPSKVRNRFRNDPASFLDFCNDPKNIDEMVELGLAEKTPDSSSRPQNAGGANQASDGGKSSPDRQKNTSPTASKESS